VYFRIQTALCIEAVVLLTFHCEVACVNALLVTCVRIWAFVYGSLQVYENSAAKKLCLWRCSVQLTTVVLHC
jgi:hypothetical protein